MPARPFNPNDDFDAVAEKFRVHIADMLLAARAAPRFARLDSTRQLECFLCGVLTGVVGCAFAHVTPEGRDDIMALLTE
ncbi:hypothetical protein, partial [Allomesorhizobium alhagi]